MYADFSCEFDGFDEFIYLTPQAKFFPPISENLGWSVLKPN